MSRDIVKVRTLRFGPFLVFGLVGAGGVEGEVSEDFAGVLLDDFDVEVVDEGDDALLFVAASDADFVEVSFVSDGDFAAGVDSVFSDPVGGVGFCVWGCFG